MTGKPSPKTNYWSLPERPFIWLSQRASRRSLLTRVAKVGLAIAGIRAIGEASRFVEPTLLQPEAAHANHLCSQCAWCGLFGIPCSDCGGTTTQCPSDGIVKSSNYWARCCCCWMRAYRDCCKARRSDGQCTRCSAEFNRCIASQPCWCCNSSTPCYICTTSEILFYCC